jgi:hypothetical protein
MGTPIVTTRPSDNGAWSASGQNATTIMRA